MKLYALLRKVIELLFPLVWLNDDLCTNPRALPLYRLLNKLYKRTPMSGRDIARLIMHTHNYRGMTNPPKFYTHDTLNF